MDFGTYRFINEDYAQSANMLVNFMKKSRYLKEILLSGYIVPRYCIEDIRYLNVCNKEVSFQSISVLQKCFCDIPLSMWGKKSSIRVKSDHEKEEFLSHTDIYGKYGIAFSKLWGEKKGLQPVHYLNPDSEYAKKETLYINSLIDKDNLDELYADELLRRLAFFKPLRGEMERGSGKDKYIIEKNFHDEKEWRYVPEICEESNLPIVIANQVLKPLNENINDSIKNDEYDTIRLYFNHNEIKYIIVPDADERNNLISTIRDISEDKFDQSKDIELQKDILISKIMVLDEIEKDW